VGAVRPRVEHDGRRDGCPAGTSAGPSTGLPTSRSPRRVEGGPGLAGLCRPTCRGAWARPAPGRASRLGSHHRGGCSSMLRLMLSHRVHRRLAQVVERLEVARVEAGLCPTAGRRMAPVCARSARAPQPGHLLVLDDVGLFEPRRLEVLSGGRRGRAELWRRSQPPRTVS